jgi:hypothetical protein
MLSKQLHAFPKYGKMGIGNDFDHMNLCLYNICSQSSKTVEIWMTMNGDKMVLIEKCSYCMGSLDL